jgi:hypothetical protein
MTGYRSESPRYDREGSKMPVLRLIRIGPPTSDDEAPTVRGPSTLSLDTDGRLIARSNDSVSIDSTALGVLRPGSAGADWLLLTANEGLLLNGAKPLPLAVVEPGDLIAAGSNVWFVTTEWVPKPAEVSAELADRPCPVCGGELKLAHVVRCVCGRYAHLEDPTAPDDPALLNCYLASPCGLCGRAPSLSPVLVPEPPVELVDEVTT